jgi:hypothetical protein
MKAGAGDLQRHAFRESPRKMPEPFRSVPLNEQ